MHDGRRLASIEIPTIGNHALLSASVCLFLKSSKCGLLIARRIEFAGFM
jgi:hypothetical protein